MMKPIKVRAWDKRYKAMDYDLWLHFDGRIFDRATHTYDTPNQEIELVDEDRYELMQFTGLLDRKGKEIWEGDICKITFFHDPKHEDIIGVVAWIESLIGFSIRTKSGSGLYSLNFKTGGNFGDRNAVEVIGNIYENPDLLEAK